MDKLKEKPNTKISDKLKLEQDLFKKACRLIFAHKKLRTETLKEYDELKTQIAMKREKQWRKNERKKHREFREQIMRARENREIEEQTSKAVEELKEKQKGVVRRELLQQWISRGEKTFEERLCEIHFWEEIEREHKEVVRRHNEYELMYYKLFHDVKSIDTTSSSGEETPGKQKDEFSEVKEINLPLTEEARKSMQYKIKEEKDWNKIIAEKNLKKHLKSVKKIKKRMLATRAAHSCHREERMRREAGKKRQMMDTLRTKLNIDIHTLPRGGAAVLERYEQYEREKEELKKGQAQRRDEIVGRLLRERVRAMNTRLAHRGAPRAQDFTTNTVPVRSVGEDKEWRYHVQERDSRRALESVPVVDRPAKKIENDRFAMEEAIHQDKDDQKLINVRNENDEEGSKQLKTQIDQAESSHRPPPESPRRHRIEACNMMSSFKVIHRHKDALAREVVEHMGVPPPSRPIDTAISWRPPVAIFKDFRPDHIYQRTITVKNISRTKVVSWFDTLLLDDDTDPKVIQVERLDCQRLWPGSTFSFTLTFRPVSYTPELTGHVVFLTRRDGLQVEEFHVPVNCLAARPEPCVSPLDIRFNTVPGWTRRRHGVVIYKSVQVSNVGARPCVCRIVTLAEEERGCRQQELKIYLEDHESENLKTIQNANQDQQIELNLTDSKKESISFEQSQKSIKSFKRSRITLQSDESNGIFDTAETFLRSSGLYRTIHRATQTINSSKTANGVATKEGHTDESYCLELVEECVDNVLRVILFYQMYHLRLEPRTSTDIQVRFHPEAFGPCREDFVFLFEDDSGESCGRVQVSVSGETTSLPLVLEPAVLQFGVCFMDGGVYHQNYHVTNQGRAPASVVQRVPGALQTHVTLNPRETYLQPGETRSLCVQIAASSEIVRDGPQYYDQELQMLKFPVLVHPLGPLYGDSPPLVLEVFALLTCPSAIVLTPGSLDFGRVTTLETVTASIRLTNCSLAAQYYGFLRLPKGVSVQPGHGFGYVLPQHTVPLVILYSPCPMDIQGNVIGQNGVNGTHTFTLRCATVAASLTTPHRGVYNSASMSGKSVTPPPETPAGTVASVSFLQEDMALGSPGSLDNIEEETVLNVKDLDVISTDLEIEVLSERDARLVPLTTGLLQEENCSADNIERYLRSVMEGCGSAKSRRFEIKCCAHVVDPLCQLSCTCLLLPSTPCGSYAVATVRIQPNLASRTRCLCGVLSDKRSQSQRHAWFEFKSPREELSVQPRRGDFRVGEEVKVSVMFCPKLDKTDIDTRARLVRADKEREERERVLKQQEEARQQKPARGEGRPKAVPPAKSSSYLAEQAGADPQTTEPDPSELFQAQNSLLEVLEPWDFSCKITCLVETRDAEQPEETRCPEVLFLDVLCPVVRPDILLRGEEPHVRFGPTALGTRPKRVLMVENISRESVRVSATPLNPVGPFLSSLVNSVKLEPGCLLSITLTFTPETEGEEYEMFELHGARTILPLTMSGSGVTPDYQFTPDFLLYRFEGRTGKTVDLTLEIKNTCSAPLPLQIREVFTRAALDKPSTPPPSPEPQAKGKPKKEKKPPKMSSVLSPEDKRSFEKHFRDIKKEGALIFSVVIGTSDSVSEAMLVVPPGEKVTFKVRFTPPTESVSFIRDKMSGETEELPQRDDTKTKQVNIDGRGGLQPTGEAKGKKPTTERDNLDPEVNKSRKKRKQSVLTGKKGAAQYQAAEIVYPLKYAVKYRVSLGNIIDVRELIFIGRVLPGK